MKLKLTVSLLEGRFFDAPTAPSPPPTVYLQAALLDRVLSTPPTPLCPTPRFYTNLVWELDAALMHYLRTQRTSIKLHCYQLNEREGER